MIQPPPYGDYLSDVAYQLEFNLQNIRRDLVNLLEDKQFDECFACNKLKCQCLSEGSCRSTILTLTSSDSACPRDRDRSFDVYHKAAPPPETLPKPKWRESKPGQKQNGIQKKTGQISKMELNKWVKASVPSVNTSNTQVNFPVPEKVLHEDNYSWPPFPGSIWSKERSRETVARETLLLNDTHNSVEAFFRYFSGKNIVPKAPATV